MTERWDKIQNSRPIATRRRNGSWALSLPETTWSTKWLIKSNRAELKTWTSSTQSQQLLQGKDNPMDFTKERQEKCEGWDQGTMPSTSTNIDRHQINTHLPRRLTIAIASHSYHWTRSLNTPNYETLSKSSYHQLKTVLVEKRHTETI